MEKNSVGCAGLKVRVDGLLLPPWALNNHHFVYTNFMALERDRVREQLGHWIDLIFGVHQQDPARHNLFKPLTAEVSNPSSPPIRPWCAASSWRTPYTRQICITSASSATTLCSSSRRNTTHSTPELPSSSTIL